LVDWNNDITEILLKVALNIINQLTKYGVQDYCNVVILNREVETEQCVITGSKYDVQIKQSRNKKQDSLFYVDDFIWCKFPILFSNANDKY